jgi:hypothetical protein
MKRVTIAIASPGDVHQEREAVRKVFTNWNDKNNQATLHPKMWEFAVPELGDHPQHILNQKIIDTSDLLIAIFWSKVGTPTPDAPSGTIEEIYEFIKKKGAHRVMLYFCTRDLPNNIDPAELMKLNEFKAKMKTRGLFHQYSTVHEFERDLYPHLDSKVEQFLANELPLPVVDSPVHKSEAANDSHPDKRLHNLIDFGTTLKSISQGFAKRMDEFQSIDGCTNDKYYLLGSHVYSSAADCLDRFLIYSSAGVSAQNHAMLEKISSRLKRLASDIPGPKALDFRTYWNDGSETAKDLLAQVAHIEKSKNN